MTSDFRHCRLCPPETVTYSAVLRKVNAKGKVQDRAFVITSRGLYNFEPGKYRTAKRRIAFESLVNVLLPKELPGTFVLHTTEYDYRWDKNAYMQD
jgi:hypothetical protein